MGVSAYIAPFDRRAAAAHLGLLLELLAVLLIVPAVAAGLLGEPRYGAIFLGIAAFAFALGAGAARLGRGDLALREALAVTALAYLAYALLCGAAFLPVAPYLDGVFEAMSGFTTTGLSLLDPERLPRSLVFFRSYSQWIGGAGIVVLSVHVLLPPGRSSLRLFAAETKSPNLLGSVAATARAIVAVYVGLTGAGAAAFALAGMTPWDALLHAMSTLSTGGFSSRAAGLGAYPEPRLHLAVGCFMLVGCLSLPTLVRVPREGPGALLRDGQARLLVAVAALGFLFLWALQGLRADAALPAFFQTASALSTSGYEGSLPSARWPEAGRAAMIALMIVGGASGSTAGGIKLVRLALAAAVARWWVRRAMLPEEARTPVKLGGEPVSEGELRDLLAFLTLYAALLLGTALALSASGRPFLDGLFEGASALSTVGLSSGIASPGLAPGLKALLILDMWIGRVEILPVLVLLHPGAWLGRRRAP